MPKDSVCAEIGVWKGDFSRQILERTLPRRLHLIDPWEYQPEFPDRKFGGKHFKSQEGLDKLYEAVEARFRGDSNVRIHRAPSHEALEGFENGSLDWIYIDGNHAFDYVMRDLTLALAKVRSGGFITGDDYTWGRKCGFPVERAVKLFAEKNALEDRIDIIESQFLIELP